MLQIVYQGMGIKANISVVHRKRWRDDRPVAVADTEDNVLPGSAEDLLPGAQESNKEHSGLVVNRSLFVRLTATMDLHTQQERMLRGVLALMAHTPGDVVFEQEGHLLLMRKSGHLSITADMEQWTISMLRRLPLPFVVTILHR